MQQGNRLVRANSHFWTPWATLATLLVFAAANHQLYKPPPPLSVDAPAAVFSAQRAAGVLRELIGAAAPHPLASAADSIIREQIVRRLAALGVPVELQSGWACDTSYVCGFAVNIVARIDGSDPSSDAVLLAAHYDSVPAGPGAGDDGNGVASILEIARILKLQPALPHPVILLFDEGEEAGLLGARLFVATHPAARSIKAAVNLEARGDSGPSLMFETGAATDWAMRLYAKAIARPMSNSLYYFIYKLLPNDTDFTVFKAAGYEGFNFALIGDVERYHTPQDRLENLDLGSLQQQGDNALATVRALAATELSHPVAAHAVFFDVFGRTLLRWPASWAAPLGVGFTTLFFWALMKIGRRVGARLQSVAYGFAAIMCAWLGAIAVTVGLLAVLRAAGAVPPAVAYSWAAHPGGMHAACVALALLAPVCAARLFASRTESWSLWLANALLIAGLALVTALKFPELSFLFLVPVLTSLLGAALALRGINRSQFAVSGAIGVPALVAALPVLGTGFVFIPSLLLTYPALGTDAWPIITAALGLVVLGLAPMLADAHSQSYRSLSWLTALTVVFGAGLSLMRPPYSAQMPQRTLVWYVLDADAGRAQWLVQTDSHRLHLELAQTSANSGNAQAVALNLPPPQLEILGRERHGSDIDYRLRIRSPRAAPELELAVPRELAATAVQVVGGAQPWSIPPWRAPDHSAWFKFIGVPPAGLELRLKVSVDKDAMVRVIDRSYGLPAVAALPSARATNETSSQDGDLTVVYRSVQLGASATAPSP